jgi:type II secretory pathway pseudopilin PulG
LAVVLMILGVLLAVALPRLPRLARADLESSGDRLAATMQYLADEATLRGRTYRMRLDLDAEEWTVDALAPWSAGSDGQPRTFQRVADDDMARRTRMPPGIDLAAVTDARGEQATGQRDVFFLPEGIPEGLSVRLRESEGHATTEVVLDAARSTARRGDVEEKPK